MLSRANKALTRTQPCSLAKKDIVIKQDGKLLSTPTCETSLVLSFTSALDQTLFLSMLLLTTHMIFRTLCDECSTSHYNLLTLQIPTNWG
jgi:hypothetical protein